MRESSEQAAGENTSVKEIEQHQAAGTSKLSYHQLRLKILYTYFAHVVMKEINIREQDLFSLLQRVNGSNG